MKTLNEIAHSLEATPESDKKLRMKYTQMGMLDRLVGEPPKDNLDGLVKEWYMEGYSIELLTE